MTLELIDFVVETDGVDLEDFPPEVQKRINEELDELTGGDGGPGSDPDNPPQSIIVDAGGDGDYESIQTAIDERATSGDVIFVEPGEYGSFTVDVEDLTLEGPNAGIAGDSDQRGDEASFEVGGAISADNVTIDGFELTGSSFSSVTAENTVIRNTAADVDDSAVVRLEDGSDGTVITRNTFTGDGGNFVINARQNFGELIDGVEITDNNFESITGDGKTAIQAAGFTNAEISGNSFDGISQDAVRLAGNVSGTEVTGNEFSNYAQNSGFPAGAIIANDISGDNIDISSNQFNDPGGDDIYVIEFSGDDQAGVLALSAIEDSNTFNPSVVRVGDRLLPAVDSDGELKSALDADFEDAGDESEEGLGETIPLNSGYTSSLDGSDVRTQNVVSVEEGTYTQVFLDKSQINTDSSFTTDRGSEAISGAYIQENGQVQYLNVIIQGGNVFFFVPERLQGEEITFAVGNMNQDDGGDFAELSGDDIVIGNITVAS